MKQHYNQKYGQKPVFGMIHLAGQNPVNRALEEMEILEEEGFSGIILQNLHGNLNDLIETLKQIDTTSLESKIGLNILPNEFYQSLPLAQAYGADFVQLENIAGSYKQGELNTHHYDKIKNQCGDIDVFGGVWPKYHEPLKHSVLEEDLQEGMNRADVIVVTGAGTGLETPLKKIQTFRQTMGQHPLIIASGLTPENVYEQFCLADGAIVGTALKYDNNTRNKIDKYRARDFMDATKEANTMSEFLPF